MKIFNYFVGLTIFVFFTSCQENFDKRCAREAAEFTATQCPQQLEPGNVLDSMAYDIKTRTYHYYYTLSGKWDTPTSLESIKSQDSILRYHLLDKLKNDISLNACKKEKINFSYKYFSGSTNNEFFNVTATTEIYTH